MHESEEKVAVVTGGAGFVGSHLCKRLLEEGYRVISLDNYFTGTEENHIAGVEYRNGHTKDIEQHITETPDVLFHLGEYSRVAASLKEPDVVFDLNLHGTFGVLEFWRKHECKLLYAGSSTKQVGPREDGVSGRDLSPYTLSKAVNTEYVADYARWYGLSYATVYFYNVYGPGERSYEQYGTVIETFRQCYLSDRPLQVRKPGTQVRAFTHVEDTVEGIMLAAKKGDGDDYGISAEPKFSLLEVAEMFGRDIEMLEPTPTTRFHAETDTTRIRSLGWKQKHFLVDYIEEVKKQKK
jgi:UDP-glucose 4-epimerase